MKKHYFALQTIAADLERAGNAHDAATVREAAEQLVRSESEIGRLLVDVEVLNEQLVAARAAK